MKTAEDWRKEGVEFRNNGQYGNAIICFDRCIEIDTNNADAYYGRGITKYYLSDYHGAIEDYNKTIEVNPNDAEAYFFRGNAKFVLSDYRGAIEDYNKAIEINPNFAEAYGNRGWIKLNFYLFDYLGVIEDCNKAIEINPKLAEVYRDRGNAKKALSDYHGAIEDYNKAIEINSKLVEVFNNRGLAKSELKNYHGAMEDYDKAIEINPKLVEAYKARGYAKYDLKNYHGAIEDCNKAIELNPNDAVVYCNRSLAKGNLENYRGAIEDCNRAIEINPKLAEAYHNRGLAKCDLENYHSAIEDYTETIKINPNDAKTYHNRGIVYKVLKKNANAISDWLTSLYLSIKQNDIKCIRNLLRKSLIDNPDTLFLVAYPQNIKYTFEHLNLHASSYFHFQSACDKLKDFDLLLQYYENTEKFKDRDLLSAKALLYYYLGGNIQSFCIYDERLDDDNNSMSAQELYYYALTAQEIGYYEAQVILEDYCICQLEEKTDKTNEEYYYLGRLYLLNREDEKAMEQFEKSSDFKFSTIMLKGFIDENDYKSLALSGEIDYNKGISQFSDYFYFYEFYHIADNIDENECQDEVESEIEYERLWEAFSFIYADRIVVTEEIRQIEAEKIKEKLQIEFAKIVEAKIAGREEIFKKEIRDELVERKKIVTKEFDYIENAIEKGRDVENQLGLMIEEFEYNSPQFYSYLIQLYYLEEKINSEGIFTLYFYLINTLKKKENRDAGKIMDLLAELGTNAAGINLFYTAAKTTYSIIANLSKEYEEFSAMENELSDYRNFKQNFWRFIDNDRETLSGEKFQQKYITFEWLEKEM